MKLSVSHIESKYDILKLSYIGTTLLMALTVFVILRFLCPCLLSNHEQYQLFLWSSDYALSRFVQPGGIARYVAEFVVQYYNNFLVGSILITILFAIMQWLSLINVLRFIGNGWQSLTLSLLVPMIMMLITSDADVMTTLVISYVVCLIAMAFVPLLGVVSIILCFALVPILYWIAGPVVIFFSLYMALSWTMLCDSRLLALLRGILLLLFTLICIFLSQYVSEYSVFVLFRGVDYFRYPVNPVPLYWLLALPALFPLLSLVCSYKHILKIEIACLLSVIVAIPLSIDRVKYEQMEYALFVRMQHWNLILEKSSKSEPIGVPCKLAVNLALYKTHCITPQELVSRSMEFSNETNKTMFDILGEVFFHIGMVNYSQRFAFEQMEAIPNFNKSGRLIKRLTETSLVSGNYRLAKKYLDILSLAPFYRSWAEDVRQLLINPELLEQHPVYGPLIHTFPTTDDLMT